ADERQFRSVPAARCRAREGCRRRASARHRQDARQETCHYGARARRSRWLACWCGAGGGRVDLSVLPHSQKFLTVRSQILGQYFVETAHDGQALRWKKPPVSIPSVPI